MKSYKWLVPTFYIVFLMLPIYWLLNMSFKTTNEILGVFSLWPQNFTLGNYAKIFTDPTWYNGYINSITYVVINTVISVSVALPAAYAFSRYRFLGDKHLDEPHGSAGDLRIAVLSIVFRDRAVRHAPRRGAGPLPFQYPPCGLDSRRFHVRGSEGAG
jgi:hypothetical protein